MDEKTAGLRESQSSLTNSTGQPTTSNTDIEQLANGQIKKPEQEAQIKDYFVRSFPFISLESYKK